MGKGLTRKTPIDESVLARISHKEGKMRAMEIFKFFILLTVLGEGTTQSELDRGWERFTAGEGQETPDENVALLRIMNLVR